MDVVVVSGSKSNAAATAEESVCESALSIHTDSVLLPGVPSLSCVADTLRRCVTSALDAGSTTVNDIVTKCRHVARHFSHSRLAADRLADIQHSIPGLEHTCIFQVTLSTAHLAYFTPTYSR